MLLEIETGIDTDAMPPGRMRIKYAGRLSHEFMACLLKHEDEIIETVRIGFWAGVIRFQDRIIHWSWTPKR